MTTSAAEWVMAGASVATAATVAVQSYYAREALETHTSRTVESAKISACAEAWSAFARLQIFVDTPYLDDFVEMVLLDDLAFSEALVADTRDIYSQSEEAMIKLLPYVSSDVEEKIGRALNTVGSLRWSLERLRAERLRSPENRAGDGSSLIGNAEYPHEKSEALRDSIRMIMSDCRSVLKEEGIGL